MFLLLEKEFFILGASYSIKMSILHCTFPHLNSYNKIIHLYKSNLTSNLSYSDNHSFLKKQKRFTLLHVKRA